MLLSICAAVPTLLMLYWSLAAGAATLALFPLPGLGFFRTAVLLSASRGKTWQSRPSGLGHFKDMSVPQAWFSHFYIVGAIVNAAIIYWISWHWSTGQGLPNAEQVLHQHVWGALALQIHLLRRAYESVAMLLYYRHDRMHTVAYVFGLSYYVFLPLSLIPDDWWMSLCHVHLRLDEVMYMPEGVSRYVEAGARSVEGLQLLGVLIFLAGSILQFLTHRSLSLLKVSSSEESESGHVYKVPRGGLFELVSCPHYLAEIIIYWGLLIVTGFKPIINVIILWVESNLALAAFETHTWYRKRFEDYPKHRKAIIPFLI